MRANYKNTIENKKGPKVVKLSEERIAALNEIEGWKWEEEDPFQDNLDHWITHYQKRGNKTPNNHSKDPEEKRAGQWQSDMRKNYKNTIENKKGTKLSDERIAALNETEGWKWEEEDPFIENLHHWITQYQQKENKTPSQSTKDPEEKRAAIWQNKMRNGYKKKVSWLTQERIAALNETEGWKWGTQETRNTYTFEEQLTNWITQFKKRGNKTPRNSAKDPEEKRAAQWQSNMRQGYKNTIENKKGNKLSEERIAALNETEGWKWSG